jgi:Flp pilus assembly protein TadG
MNRTKAKRGNAVIETALILTPLLALIMAILDYGVAAFLKSTFLHATREGVRYAVTYKVLGGMGQDASIKTIVQRNAMGFLNGTAGANLIDIHYYLPDTFTETTQNYPGNIVEVAVEGYQWRFMVPLWRQPGYLTINARSLDRMEGLPAGSGPPAR